MTSPTINGQPIPDSLFGRFIECNGDADDGDAVRRHLENDGYVLLRGVLNAAEVIAAREEIFGRLAEVGEVTLPAIEGIATGESRRPVLADDRHAFWKSVSEGAALRAVTHGTALRGLLETVLGESARPHDLLYLRPTPVGRSTNLHYDYPFFAGRSQRIHTAWVPLGDVPISDGPLAIIEGSNRFDDLIDPLRSHDFAAQHSNDTVQEAAYDAADRDDPIAFVRQRATRILSTDFHVGDLLVFGGFTLHGSLDNCSPAGRIRLSCDVRYQPTADPADDVRYFGPDPHGSKGGGYGDMRGAKPLVQSEEG